jgi:hypothetical protein
LFERENNILIINKEVALLIPIFIKSISLSNINKSIDEKEAINIEIIINHESLSKKKWSKFLYIKIIIPVDSRAKTESIIPNPIKLLNNGNCVFISDVIIDLEILL